MLIAVAVMLCACAVHTAGPQVSVSRAASVSHHSTAEHQSARMPLAQHHTGSNPAISPSKNMSTAGSTPQEAQAGQAPVMPPQLQHFAAPYHGTHQLLVLR